MDKVYKREADYKSIDTTKPPGEARVPVKPRGQPSTQKRKKATNDHPGGGNGHSKRDGVEPEIIRAIREAGGHPGSLPVPPDETATPDAPPDLAECEQPGGRIEGGADRPTARAALEYLEAGVSIHPVPSRSKKPPTGWPEFEADRAKLADQFPEPSNIGFKCGAKSSGLCDLDYDWPEARRMAAHVLPEMPSFGRASSLHSHRLVRCPDAEARVTFSLNKTLADTLKLKGEHAAMVCELRGNGVQSILPFSVHKETGEPIEWTGGGTAENLSRVPEMAWPEAERRQGLVAFLAVMLRYYPPQGDRDVFCMAVCGALVDSGVDGDEASRFVEALAIEADDEEASKRQKGRRTEKKADAGKPHTGLTRACKLAGLPNEIVPMLAAWLQRRDQDGEELDRLAKLPVLEYERQREKAAETLGSRASVLDKAVAARRRELADEASGTDGLAVTNGEPWPEPVDGKDLVQALATKLKDHVVLPDNGAETTALHILHCHAHDAFQISPILAIQSPQKRCGKTTLMRVIEGLVPRAISADNITAAALFRVIHALQPTMMLDEADTFLKSKERGEEIRGILNSGHRRGGTVLRTVGEKHEVQAFSTWAPKIIAGIDRLPDTLQDRSIVITLRRRLPSEKVKRRRGDRNSDLIDLNRKAARWAIDNLEALREIDPIVPDALNDRAADNWRILLAIAERVGGSWPETARKGALNVSGNSGDDDESSNGVQLLADTRDVFESMGKDALTPTELLEKLIAMPERQWAECRNHGRDPLSLVGLAKLLKPFDIKSEEPARGVKKGRSVRAYQRAGFADAWARYVPASHPISDMEPKVSDDIPF